MSARAEKKMTQKELAQKCNMDVSIINESGKPLSSKYVYGLDSGKYYTVSSITDHRSGVTRNVTSTTITLAADAPAVDITGSIITLVRFVDWASYEPGATADGSLVGKGVTLNVSSYNTTTKVATISSGDLGTLYYFSLNPSNKFVYSIGSNKSNKLGQVGGAFYMPLATFRSGERVMRITESFNNTYDTEALSYADKSFVSSGIQLKKTNLIETVYNTNIQTKIVGTQTSDRLLGSSAAGTEIVNRTTTSYAPPPADGGSGATTDGGGGDGGAAGGAAAAAG
jgi:hypothetical protein